MTLNRIILIAGLAIIVGTNLIALGGVAYNRSGEPDAVIDFTERELAMPSRYGMSKENTGLGLRINCRLEAGPSGYSYATPNCWGNPVWLTQEKLIDLGFAFQPRQETTDNRWVYDKFLPRKVYLVMEYNGGAYQRTLAIAEEELAEEQELLINNPGKEEFEKRLKKAQDKLFAEQNYNSRLFVIDAGLDKAVLRNAYPDTSQYTLMQALIKPQWNYNKDNSKDEWIGTITDLLIDTINIPLEHHAIFDPLEDLEPRYNEKYQGPRYKVRVAFGKRAEPWVIAVEAM